MAPHQKPRLSALLSLLVLLSIHSARAQGAEHDFFAVVNDAVFLPTNGLSPPPGPQQRYYLPAIPAYPALGSLEEQQRWRQRQRPNRQQRDDDDVQPIDCGAGNHTCLDAGPNGAQMCCPDNRYCFAGQDLQVHCCALGNVCTDDTPCPSGFNYCVTSQTVTTTVTRTPSASSSPPPSSSGGAAATATTETLVTYPTSAACCNRPCATESFQCGPAFGSQCCALGQRCALSGQCLSDVTSTPPPVANPVPSGCTYTYQFACDAAAGSGCCATGQTCRAPSFCDGEPATPAVTGPNGETLEPVGGDGGAAGLSSGAKAGVGIAVAVGVLGVGTALAAFCLRRRSRRNAGGRHASTTLLSDGAGGANHNRHRGANNAGGSGGGGGSGGSRIRDIFHMGPLSPVARRERRGTVVDSEMSGPTSAGGTYYGNASSGGGGGGGSGVAGSNGGGGGGGGGVGGRRPQPYRTGLTQDYFGPEAVVGPYTDGPDMSPVAAPKRQGGVVGVQPQSPNDIMTPVEIGSSRVDADASDRMGIVLGGGGGGGGGGHQPHYHAEGGNPHHDGNRDEAAGGAGGAGAGGMAAAHGLVELPGSPPLPSPSPPMSSGEADEPRRTLSPSP
ncbi:hypothetical protein SLS62_003845 [Diatrype stigma]|uniref:Uncharacterized protein n=1 Tax=Diatrype stigma TaxID=117547 RepID=A0AAN9UW22_9PEZI